jgi:acetolactate synthase-1/2/3 large subunit
MATSTVPTESVAEAYLALLRDRGIEHIFVNGGTDFAPIAEAYARAEESGLELPAPVIVPHENVAVGMAHGAYLVTGKPQVVMLHVSVGSANAVMAIMNAARDRAPILLTAGRTPLFEQGALGARNGQIHWAQEMFDQAGMLREMLKWDYELRDGLQVLGVVDRAISVATSEPKGPIYLTLPREVLARPLEGLALEPSGQQAASAPGVLPSAVDELADLIAGAHFPVIVASAAVAEPGAFAALQALASEYAIGVLENAPRRVNANGISPMHLGYGTRSVFGDADLLVFAECDVPWIPSMEEPPADTTIVQCGVDPVFSRYPIRTHRSDLLVTGSTKQLFVDLATALESRKEKIDSGRFDRIAQLATERRELRRSALQDQVEAKSGITKAFMNSVLTRMRPPEAIVVDEYWARADVLQSTIEGTEFHNPPAGGLGWGLPAALGVQLESPDRVVIATLGDGAYMFANPPACHQVMSTYQLPVLTIICNNGRWGAVEGSARGMYPTGHTAKAGSSVLAALDKSHAFELYAEATGGYGEKVTTRDEFEPALARALDVVQRERRHVVLNVLSED